MLRLEKAKNREINVHLRRKRTRLNWSLIKAFAAAVALHLFAAMVFHIHLWINQEDGILPYIQVNTDLDHSGDKDVILDYSKEQIRSSRHPLEPLASIPQFPAIPTHSPERQMEYIETSQKQNNLFSFIEEDWSYLTANHEKFTPPKPIQINPSGDLGDLPLINNGLEKIALPDLPGFCRAVFAVQVEGKTGRIFWQDAIELPREPELQTISEQILNNIRFQPIANAVVTTGEIELVYRN